MFNLIYERILAADEQGAENFIFLVIIGFWIIAGIVKGLSKKAKKGDSAPKSEPARPLKQKKASARPPGQAIAQSIIQKLSEIADGYEQQAQDKAQETIELSPKPVPRPVKPPVVQQKPPAYDEIPSAMDRDIQELYPKPSVKKKKQVEKTSYVPALFDNRDELKKAILYNEILGKPLSLREPPS